MPTDVNYKRRIQLAWCAGVLSVYGSFSHQRANAYNRAPRLYPTLQLRRKGNSEVLVKFRRIMKVKNQLRREKIGSGAEVWNVKITGNTLEMLMEEVWEFLTEERKEEYLQLNAWIVEQNRKIA